ncbi:hypothetical protein LRAMOSA08389 [Lichtheimia ramosa]|uniref:RING-type E3 ubiquitin transferase n=1 Tax=Lichtheimia ramosa TaxID=688394 RepID=A0A077WDY8_9FUNG|nr:hypothetical protein LRAMOSA08389 [Lichtheimia ramosa]
MSTTVQPTPRYFCYACNDEVPIYLTPDPTCQLCNDQFVQEVESGSNDPRSFFTRGDNGPTRRRTLPASFSPFDSVDSEFFALARHSFDDRDHHQQATMNPEVIESFNNWMTSMLDTSIGTTRYERHDDNHYASYHTRSTTTSTENEQLRPNIFSSALIQFLHGMGMPNDGFASNLDDYVFSQDALDQIMTQLMNQSNGNAPPPAPANVIESLPIRKLNQKEVADKEDCAVCKDEYASDDHVIELECAHVFHPDCIKPWLKINGTCPVCRKVIDGTKNDKQKSNSHQHATRDRASNFSASTNTISALFDTTRRLFGHGTSSSSSSSSETRQNTTSSMPGSYTRQQRRFDPNSDYMNLDLD